MTKADIVSEIAKNTGIEKVATLKIVEAMMDSIKNSIEKGDNVYLRGFGSFITKKRAKKTARNITKNTSLVIPEHFIPAFKPAKTFMVKVRDNVKK
ncbi:MAG: integration host factor subunit beta [Salinivirgaceae bacterium]|jgi:DNA-binding protein HU-beta|nr:integration host factor subunit beta [Salinivirgaceae bacterium]MBR4620104.1 integration host factor subunit beta [Salinivirgaceae bacterium]MBR5644341.1 integration host factor subunit beta [Salinivirgaceae bacterium]